MTPLEAGEIEKWAGEGLLNTWCEHPAAEIRNRPAANGARRLWRQCLVCGSAVGTAVKLDRQDHPCWDHGLYERYKESLDEIRKANREKKRAAYAEYLATSKWRVKADTVLKRANYICEGCGVHRATQVHHLTYQNIFNEFLFELVAVCAECHRSIHSVAP